MDRGTPSIMSETRAVHSSNLSEWQVIPRYHNAWTHHLVLTFPYKVLASLIMVPLPSPLRRCLTIVAR